MNTERLQDWLQILGIIGIIASLIFVGQQLKQDRHIAESEAWLSYVDTQVALSQLINENAKIWAEGLAGAELSPLDTLKFHQIAFAVEAKYSSAFARSESGIRGEPVAQVAKRFAHDLYANIGLRRAVFTRWKHQQEVTGRERPFHADVRIYLEKIESGEIEPVTPEFFVH